MWYLLETSKLCLIWHNILYLWRGLLKGLKCENYQAWVRFLRSFECYKGPEHDAFWNNFLKITQSSLLGWDTCRDKWLGTRNPASGLYSQRVFVVWFWSTFSFTNRMTISNHKLTSLRKEVEIKHMTLTQEWILGPRDEIHFGIRLKSFKGTLSNKKSEGPLLGGTMKWMWEVMQAMLNTGTENGVCFPARLCWLFLCFILLMSLEWLMFSGGLSPFSFCVIISQLKCKVAKAVVSSLVFIIKYPS